MKTIILFCVMLSAVARVNAQERQFKNFEVQKGEYNTYYILASNFAKEYEALKQEFLSHDYFQGYYGDTLSLTDSINRWLDKGHHLEMKGKMDYGFGFDKLIPDSLRKRLQGVEPGFNKCYFNAYALINSEGKILSVYFQVERDMLHLFQEDELQAMCDGILRSKIDPKRIRFTQLSRTLFKKIENVSGEELIAMGIEDFAVFGIPCRYGTIRCLDGIDVVIFQGEDELKRLLFGPVDPLPKEVRDQIRF